MGSKPRAETRGLDSGRERELITLGKQSTRRKIHGDSLFTQFQNKLNNFTFRYAHMRKGSKLGSERGIRDSRGQRDGDGGRDSGHAVGKV